MLLKELHEAIQNNDYSTVERIIVDEGVNPLDQFNSFTTIELCFNLQRKNKQVKENIYQEMLDNLIFPQIDRYLIGNGKADRGDIMIINDNGSIQILDKSTMFDEDNTMFRKIGNDDYRLSKDFRDSRRSSEKAFRV